MILTNNIGFWNYVHTETMPDSRFLIQSDRFSFNELVRSSSLPSFTTDLAKKYLAPADLRDLRTGVSVSAPEATVTYYPVRRKEAWKAHSALFGALRD